MWEGGRDAVRFKSDTKSGGLWHTLSLYLRTNGTEGGAQKHLEHPLQGRIQKFPKGRFRPAIQWCRERGGGGGGHMSPGAGLRGRRSRREIINYRVNENSRTHRQIQGAVVNAFI